MDAVQGALAGPEMVGSWALRACQQSAPNPVQGRAAYCTGLLAQAVGWREVHRLLPHSTYHGHRKILRAAGLLGPRRQGPGQGRGPAPAAPAVDPAALVGQRFRIVERWDGSGHPNWAGGALGVVELVQLGREGVAVGLELGGDWDELPVGQFLACVELLGPLEAGEGGEGQA